MFNDVFLIQFLIFGVSALFITIYNTFLLWYCVIILLLSVSALLFLDNFDIFVGFLLLIDLGVILIFLILVFHFINFLDNKIFSKKPINFFFPVLLVSFFILSHNFFKPLVASDNIFSFLISWYDYFLLQNNVYKTDLNLIKEMYFYNNSFEFILINFFILYGLVLSLMFFFVLKKVNLKQFFLFFKSFDFKNTNSSYLFIRNQNLLNQQDEGASLKIINKKKW